MSSMANRSRISRLCVGLAWLVTCVGPVTAGAVLIATGDGSGNTTPPAADPGFDNVGRVSGLSGVYLRNGWVLTADHVAPGAFRLAGVSYPQIPGSSVSFENTNGTSADLRVFKILGRPPVLDLLIADEAPSVGQLVTLVGNGRERGSEIDWMGNIGWTWEVTTSTRWGTNRIEGIDEWRLDTRSFSFVFDELANPASGEHEADVIEGDSGGGVFVGAGPGARLIGILFARSSFEGQPEETSVYGNLGVAADVFAYRDAILDVIDRPGCSDGLDDDLDGLIDYPADLGCTDANDPDEAPEPSGLTSIALGALALARARRGARRALGRGATREPGVG